MNGEKLKIAVFGGSGFIGKHLVEGLLNEKNEVTVFDVRKPNLSVDYKILSVLDDNLKEIVKEGNFEAIVNLAAVKGELNSDDFQINSLGAANVFQAAKDLQLPLTHISSTAVYGEFLKIPADENHILKPVSLYGLSKLLGEEIGRKIMEDTNAYTIFRPTIVYGPEGNDVITNFVRNGLFKKPIVVNNDGVSRRDFLYVKDLVDVIILGLKKKISGIFNVGTGGEYTIMEAVRVIEKFIPDLNVINRKSENPEVNQGAVDISKLRRMINFVPRYSLEQGVEETIRYYSADWQVHRYQ